MIKKGEIWILKFPSKSGKEQKGMRPAIILADTTTEIALSIPLTSNLHALKFPHTMEIKRSEKNNLEKDSIALIFHLQAIDKKRFVNKIGDLEEENIKKINEFLGILFQLKIS